MIRAPIIRKADAAKIRATVNAWLAQHATPTPDAYMEWNLATKYGPLGVRISQQHDGERLICLFGRFENPGLAQRGTCCNPYSGKWNFYISRGTLDCYGSPENAAESCLAAWEGVL